MPWTDSRTAAFSRIEIVSLVPSEGGVFGIFWGDVCLLISDSWNLKARLLDLINTVDHPESYSIAWEVCTEQDRDTRRYQVQRECSNGSAHVSGLSLRTPSVPPAAVNALEPADF